MNNKVFLVFDWPVGENNRIYSMLKEYRGASVFLRGTKQIIPNSPVNKVRFVLHYIKFCWGIVNESTSHDVIVHRLDMLAIINWWISKLTFQKRNIVCCNIMLKPASGLKGKITRFLYGKALSDTRFKATVTSAYYGQSICKYLSLSPQLESGDDRFLLLNDDYGNISGWEADFEDKGQTVFCGGNNGRDWNMVMNVAKNLENVSFSVVMPKAVYEKYQDVKPKNVKLYTGLESDEFFKLQKECSVTFLPLTTQAPAGLIVLFSASLMEKTVVISDTICSREYVEDKFNGLLANDEKHFVSLIHDVLNNQKMRLELGKNAREFIKRKGSPEAYVKKLISSINTFE